MYCARKTFFTMRTAHALSLLLFIFCCNVFILHCTDPEEKENCGKSKYSEEKNTRYLLYDVNPGEGFNLRRDVYIRVANLVHLLNQDEPWTLVLPPWGRLFHWKSREIYQMKLKWSMFFDIESLKKHVPVIEFEDYLKERGQPVVDEVYYLQGYDDMTEWIEKIEIANCKSKHDFQKDKSGRWRGWFFGFDEVYAKKFSCASFFGQLSLMKNFLMENTTGRLIHLSRSENFLHGEFGEFSSLFWKARRSLVFASELRDLGDKFRKDYLDSTDSKDKTIIEEWTKMKKDHGDAIGGPFIAVHLRRSDHLYVRGGELPSMYKAAIHVEKLLNKFDLKKVFVATDGTEEEYEEFKSYLKKTEVYRFKATKEIHENYKDGGLAIIDQWIASHARYFIGSQASTFSYRIHEEREILGFEPSMTFNRFCGDEEEDCEQPTKWTIVY